MQIIRQVRLFATLRVTSFFVILRRSRRISKRKFPYIQVTYIILFALLIIGGLSCSKVKEVEEKAPVETHGQQASGFYISGHGKGNKKNWEVKGDSPDILATDIVLLKNVETVSYGEENVVRLRADEGKYNKTSQDVYLEKNVIATTDDGGILTTESLNWNKASDEVSTKSDITIKKDEIDLTGKGAVGQPDLKKFQVQESVTMKIGNETVIACSGPLEINYNENIAVFNNDVQLEDKRGKLFADVVEIHFDPKAKTVQKMIATGHVKIIQDKNTSYSDSAIYTANDGKVLLTGNPRLIIYPGELKEDVSIRD